MATIPVDIYREDPTTDLETYEAIRLFKDTTPDGDFASAVGDDEDIVDGTYRYTLNDTGWVAGTWYRYGLVLIGGLTISDLSPAWQVEALTLAAIRSNANRAVGGGWDGTTSGTGDVDALVDVKLLDSAVSTDFSSGLWLHLPDAAAAANLVRRAESINLTTGAIKPTRNWSVAPGNGVRYSAFHFFPPIEWPGVPYNWDDVVRDGLKAFAYVDQVDLGVGDGETTRFDLAPYLGWVNEGQLRAVYLRRIVDEDADPPRFVEVDASKQGRYWEAKKNGVGGLAIELFRAPTAQQHVIVECVRQYSLPYGDTDMSDCPPALAIAAARWSAYHYLDSYLRPGKFTIEVAKAWEDAVVEASRVGSHPFQVVITV